MLNGCMRSEFGQITMGLYLQGDLHQSGFIKKKHVHGTDTQGGLLQRYSLILPGGSTFALRL